MHNIIAHTIVKIFIYFCIINKTSNIDYNIKKEEILLGIFNELLQKKITT